jgi:hypothetical protein
MGHYLLSAKTKAWRGGCDGVEIDVEAHFMLRDMGGGCDGDCG